jgi:hypothetical protein
MSMITPASFNITIVKGADFSFAFEIDISGTVLNLTGATVTAEIRKENKKSAILIGTLTAVVSEGAVTGYPSDVTLSMSDEDSGAIIAPEGHYDVLVTDASGVDTYYLRGKVTFLDSVTEKP